MATEDIHEPVNIIASFRRSARGNGLARPEIMDWRGRHYKIQNMGLRWPTTRGARMLHRFTFVVNETTFEVEFDAERLVWELLRITDGNPT